MTAPKISTSGLVLLSIWESFQQRWRGQFPAANPPSMRMMSERMLADTNALARWTNDKAHQGAHPGWRIPLRRIPEVCRVLEAGEDAYSDLMLVRLVELSLTAEGVDALVVLHWLGPMMNEFSERPVLDSQQRQVLLALEQARSGVVGWEWSTGGTQVTPELIDGLRGWLATAQLEDLEERAAEPPVTAEEAAEQRRVARKVTGQLAAAHALERAKRKTPSRKDTEALVREVRKALRATVSSQH